MPRIARKNVETSFFHVMVQGINKECIFNSSFDKNRYIYAINKYKEKCNIDILAYCIMSNHAHILIYSENVSEMSKFMHFINGFYSRYYNVQYNRIGYVFRDRFRSEAIYNEKYLLRCINYIHMNPVKANILKKAEKYAYSTCNQYMHKDYIKNNRILYEIFGDIDYINVFETIKEEASFIDVDNNEKVKICLMEYEKDNAININSIVKDKIQLKKLILFLHDIKRIKYKDIAKELKISRTTLYNSKK